MTNFYPAPSGRATNQLSQTRLLFQINHDQLAIQDLQTQLSTGRRISKASQDPTSAVKAMAAQRQLEYKSQIGSNLQSADTILSATESTLAQAQSIMTEIKGLTVSATGTTLSDDEKQAFQAQVTAAIDKLTELGNAKFRDQFIFGGSALNDPPINPLGKLIRFNGNADSLQTISDYASTIAANVAADDAFGVRSSRVQSTIDLNPSIAGNTPLASLNRGDGIRNGAISLSDGVEVFQLDLTSAYNISDVTEALSSVQLSGRELQVTLDNNGINIEYADGLGGLLRVSEVGSGNMANDLQINNVQTVGLSPVVGGDLDPIATSTTPLNQLFDGVGLGSGSFSIEQGEESYIVSTVGLTTVEDLVNRIKLSGASVEAGLDSTGRYFSLQSTESGSSLSIGENGGNLASRLGLRTMDLDTRLSTLNNEQGIFDNTEGEDLRITRNDGTTFNVDLSNTQTISDVLSRINNHVDNVNASTRVTAALATNGNGLTLTSLAGSQPIEVANVGGSQAAWGLGLVSRNEDQTIGSVAGTVNRIGGSDVSGVQVEGVFNTLLRLQQALETGNNEDMFRISSAMDEDLQRMSLARGFVGTRQQSIDSIKDLTAEQTIQLEQMQSDELDADLAKVISDLNAREAALQASLQLMGKTSQLSLFDYL
ncbi:flagellin N-terminal helical domain-containing protein [Aureliella helgolandensis]|uniref:Flagellar hook-associated protein FlgL n=1 Tax=Aureliella helgolandensis TaxID=2527968 RepID=A0A518GAU9_9BACT|nr:hypothetical protein [Aureliella helgolandensis]QDV25677.1 flagellar hook-associated protein FlgL [Aureliella helgolandensis]